MDDFKAYRAMCANRVRRLERFKKTRSFCALDQREADFSSSTPFLNSPLTPTATLSTDSDYSSGNEPESASSPRTLIPSSTSLRCFPRTNAGSSSDEEVSVAEKTKTNTLPSPARRVSPDTPANPGDAFSVLREKMRRCTLGAPSNIGAAESWRGIGLILAATPKHHFEIRCQAGPRKARMCSGSAAGDDDRVQFKQIDLMENDVSLLQQLLALGDKINEVKSSRSGLGGRCFSEASIDGIGGDFYRDDNDEEEDDFDVGGGACGGGGAFSSSMSAAVTNLYVDESERPQYFSRKNSVLRIPIPPRSSNRMGSTRIQRRPSDMLRHARPLHLDTALHSPPSPSSPPSCVSSSTDYPSSTASSSSACSTVSSAGGAKLLAAPGARTGLPSAPAAKSVRSPTSSVDSGCRRSVSSASSASNCSSTAGGSPPAVA